MNRSSWHKFLIWLSNAPQAFYDVYARTDIDEDLEIISGRIRILMMFIDLSGLRKDYEEIFIEKHNDKLIKKIIW